MKISKEEAARMIVNYDKDRIFSVTFVKRTTGDLRTITGRKGVTKDLRGGSLAFDPSSKGLVVIYDIQKMAYRMINLETICSIRLDGKDYQVVQ